MFVGADSRLVEKPALQTGDRLRGVVLDVSPDGRARIDFGHFRAVGQLPASLHAGDPVHVRVTGIGNPIFLKLETAVSAETAGPLAAEPLPFPDVSARQALAQLAGTKAADPADPAAGRIQALLDRLHQHLAPLSLSDRPETIAAKVADAVENSGLLLEKRLEGVLRHLLTGPRTPDLSSLDRHPWIRALMNGDAKGLMLRLHALADGEAPGLGTDRTALSAATARGLEDVVSRQLDAVRHHRAGAGDAQPGSLTYPVRHRLSSPGMARIGAWAADLVARMRLAAGRLPAAGEAALARISAAAEQMELLLPDGGINPAPIQRLLAHVKALLAAPGTATASEGRAALALIASLTAALAQSEKWTSERFLRQTAASIRSLADALERMEAQELNDVAGRLRPLADRLHAGATAGKQQPGRLASDVILPALSELRAGLHAGPATALAGEFIDELERLQHRLEQTLADASGAGRDRDESGRGIYQELAFALPLDQARDPARLKIHFSDRRRGGRHGEHRVSLLLNFDHLGKIRADLHLLSPDLSIRFSVTEEQTRKSLQSATGSLVAALRPYFRNLDVSATVSAEQVAQFEYREPPPSSGHSVNLTI